MSEELWSAPKVGDFVARPTWWHSIETGGLEVVKVHDDGLTLRILNDNGTYTATHYRHLAGVQWVICKAAKPPPSLDDYAVVCIPKGQIEALIEYLDESDDFDDVIDCILDWLP